jgi:hypothetical protein
MVDTVTKKPLDILKEKHGPVSKELTGLVKEHNRIKTAIRKALKENPKTVPEISTETGIPSDIVFWHLMSMKKYRKVVEGDQVGDYLKYQLPGNES